MNNDANRVAMSAADPADAVTQIDPINALCALNWSIMSCEKNRIALPERNNLGTT